MSIAVLPVAGLSAGPRFASAVAVLEDVTVALSTHSQAAVLGSPTNATPAMPGAAVPVTNPASLPLSGPAEHGSVTADPSWAAVS